MRMVTSVTKKETYYKPIKPITMKKIEGVNIHNVEVEIKGHIDRNIVDLGALTLSMHPCQSFANTESAFENISGSYFCLEGDKKAVEVGKKIVIGIGCHSFVISSNEKPLYHAGCCILSNYLSTIISAGIQVLESLNIKTDDALKIGIPLIKGTGDDAYLYAFHEVVPHLLESYDPDIIITQFGVDGHYQDPLVGLALTTRTYSVVAKTIHNLAHKLCRNRLLVLGGGGYDVSNTARCWAIMFTEICGGISEGNVEQYRSLYDEPLPQGATILEHTKNTVEKIERMVFHFHNIRA